MSQDFLDVSLPVSQQEVLRISCMTADVPHTSKYWVQVDCVAAVMYKTQCTLPVTQWKQHSAHLLQKFSFLSRDTFAKVFVPEKLEDLSGFIWAVFVLLYIIVYPALLQVCQSSCSSKATSSSGKKAPRAQFLIWAERNEVAQPTSSEGTQSQWVSCCHWPRLPSFPYFKKWSHQL